MCKVDHVSFFSWSCWGIDSLRHRAAVAEILVLLSPEAKPTAVKIIEDSNDRARSGQNLLIWSERVGNIFSEKIVMGNSDGIVLVRSCITILLSVLHNDLVYQPQVGEESFQ
jgi:hypothetical protein